MSNIHLQQERQTKSCRVARSPHARIIKSSQMPKDFFGRQNSVLNLVKNRASEECE